MSSETRKRSRSRSLEDSGPAEKRLKEDENQSKGTDCQSEDFWFDDGNIIIRVEDDLFRVHSSLLRTKSPYFSRLLSPENDDPDREVIDGCKVYQVEGGNACYFAAVLDGLYGTL